MLSNRLYELLPVIYRQRDASLGYPLQQILQIITEQVDIVENDISELYENWFIETCQDWVVPYIGDLIGYRQPQQQNNILVPRREVANTIHYRQRKGTLAILELLANDVSNWQARAVEFYKLLGWTQQINHVQLTQGKTVDLHNQKALDYLDTPFDEIAHTIDIRNQRRYNIQNVGVFIWRLKSYSVTKTPAYCLEEVSPNCYTFSILGNDTQLYVSPQPEVEPTHIAEEINLPVPIRRLAFKIDKSRFLKTGESLYYGKSLQIWVGTSPGTPFKLQPIKFSQIIPSDLTDWQYQPPPGMVAVDPVLGRIVFPGRQLPKGGVWVTYHYGFSADIGGGEYERILSQPQKYKLYQVGREENLTTISAALIQWQSEAQTHPHAVIEITDNSVYTERFNIQIEANQSLQIRAATHKRPVIRLLDYQAETTDALSITVKAGGHLTLDGLLIVGRGVQIQQDMVDFPVSLINTEEQQQETLPKQSVKITIRHCTLVPGWSLHCDCEPKRPAEPSLVLFNIKGQLQIESSIIGSIQVNQDEVQADPFNINIRDSILDATNTIYEVIDAPGCAVAHAKLSIQRCTVFGKILVHSIDLAENCIFDGLITVARRQQGCMRFCYVTPGSRTPRRYNCQPDLVEAAVQENMDTATQVQVERARVRPQFNSTRYSTPTYCQLANSCALEIKRGASDSSEMGVFHDLYQPQREATLRVRLDEYTPANMQANIIYAS